MGLSLSLNIGQNNRPTVADQEFEKLSRIRKSGANGASGIEGCRSETPRKQESYGVNDTLEAE